jgi:hypothetical protein
VTSIQEKLPIANQRFRHLVDRRHRLGSFLISSFDLRRRARPVSGSVNEGGRRQEGNVPTAVDPMQTLHRMKNGSLTKRLPHKSGLC